MALISWRTASSFEWTEVPIGNAQLRDTEPSLYNLENGAGCTKAAYKMSSPKHDVTIFNSTLPAYSTLSLRIFIKTAKGSYYNLLSTIINSSTMSELQPITFYSHSKPSGAPHITSSIDRIRKYPLTFSSCWAQPLQGGHCLGRARVAIQEGSIHSETSTWPTTANYGL